MGFFSKPFVRTLAPDCARCGRYKKNAKSDNLEGRQAAPFGKGKAGILVVAPPKYLMYDLKDNPKWGPGTLEYDVLQELFFRFDVSEDLWIMPAIQCVEDTVPGEDGEDIDFKKIKLVAKNVLPCRNTLVKFVRDHDVKMIFTFGSEALLACVGDRMTNISPHQFQGRPIPDFKLGCWVAPLIDLADMARQNHMGKRYRMLMMALHNNMYQYLNYLNSNLPQFPVWEKTVQTLTQSKDVIDLLSTINAEEPEWFDHDFETNALRPQWSDSICWSASCTFKGIHYSFPIAATGWFQPAQVAHIKTLFKDILENDKVKKCSHNMMMEYAWGRCWFGASHINMAWDTMIGQHMLNVETGTKGLKYQTFVRYGYGPYEGDVEPYTTGKHPLVPHLNCIHQAPMDTLLLYGGLDVAFTNRLRIDQMEEMKMDYMSIPYGPRDCFLNIYMPVAKVLAEASMKGLKADAAWYEKQASISVERMKEIEDEFAKGPEGVLFKSKTGRVLHVGSNDDMATLLYDIKNFPVIERTDAGAKSVGVTALEKMNSPLVETIIEYRELQKMNSTYLRPYVDDAIDGYIHPGFNVAQARSGRASSQNPNL